MIQKIKNTLLKMKTNNFKNLYETAKAKGRKRLAVVVADDDVALSAAFEALKMNITSPILIGDKSKILQKMDKLSLELNDEIEFVEELPKTQSGKIKRKELRELEKERKGV